METETKISIIMGVYNGETTLDRSIKSILNQTYTNWEFVICDDASTDGTWEILKKHKSDTRFKILKNENNLGLGGTLNHCIEHASADILARQDADDISVNSRLEEQLKGWNQFETIDVLGTCGDLFDGQGNVWGKMASVLEPTLSQWVSGSRVIHASVFMKRKAVLDVGGYNSSARRVEDYELWLKMLSKGCVFRSIPKALYKINWNFGDYERKMRRHRFAEFCLSQSFIKMLRLPLYYRLLACKSLIAILLPKKVIFYFHKIGFKLAISRSLLRESSYR